MDADGKNRNALISGQAINLAPDWSPDGKFIVFQSNRSGNFDIWIMDIATKKLTQLTKELSEEAMPKCLPMEKRWSSSPIGGK